MKVIVRIPPRWKIILVPVFCMFFLHHSFGQGARSVSGTVTDNSDESICGVNILVKGTSMGTITDIDRSYTIMYRMEAIRLFFPLLATKPRRWK
ncbi:hypothetical protein [Cyclobacterium salsum]|uniref:hypothetical protein n=1 Tax=Cyclobacterium salsum TaxID=2666329 RepID=UPI001391EB97|nr:hypothetical protein [Cyclobacterium salsum]